MLAVIAMRVAANSLQFCHNRASIHQNNSMKTIDKSFKRFLYDSWQQIFHEIFFLYPHTTADNKKSTEVYLDCRFIL